MKKIAIATGILVCTLGYTQDREYKFFEGPRKSETAVEAQTPAEPGDPQAAPIDDYLPVLLLAGMAMMAYYARKRQFTFDRP